MPACSLPLAAKDHGCKIIEVNPRESAYTGRITDLYFAQPATQFFEALAKELSL
jgi:NAD-dependent SIR2 family protein deacetylase